MPLIEFLNIDLELKSKKDISLIVKEFGNRVTVMNNEVCDGNYCVTFETGYTEENEIINEYISLVKGLSDKAKKEWDDCILKEFYFGYDCGDTPNTFRSNISTESIRALSDVGGSVVITMYPVSNENT